MLQHTVELSGVLPGWGHIIVAAYQKLSFGTIGIWVPGKNVKGRYYWTDVPKKEAKLIADALKSQDGELTAADFCPDKVNEILGKARGMGVNMQQTAEELAKKKAIYYQDNHDDIRTQQAQYYENNKQAIRARRHERYRQHRIEILERRRQRYATRST